MEKRGPIVLSKSFCRARTPASERLDHERRAAHALHAAHEEHVALAGGDRVRRVHQRAQSARAIALEHRARRLDRQSRREPRVTRHAAAVLAALVGAADDDVLDLLRLEGAISS